MKANVNADSVMEFLTANASRDPRQQLAALAEMCCDTETISEDPAPKQDAEPDAQEEPEKRGKGLKRK